MAAKNINFPWLSHSKVYDFFERRMQTHKEVKSLASLNIGLYNIVLKSEKKLTIFICDCYSFGLAQYHEASQNYGKLDAVIINSVWCGYTNDVKRECMLDEVGIFDIKGFMAAINRTDFWNYLTDQEKEFFTRQGWL